jgi:hypothetical protein
MKEQILKEFNEKFTCIDLNCNNNGTIANQISEDEVEAQQCQYCFEVRFPFRNFLSQAIDKTIEKTIEKTREEVRAEIQELANNVPPNLLLNEIINKI